MEDGGVRIREATEADVPAIRDVFASVYGEHYPYASFLDDHWLKRSVFTDDILMLVAEDEGSGRILGTASVLFDVGAHSDLLGELGRLAVHADARGRRIGHRLMQGRVDFVQRRLHLGVVENRAVHTRSQRISHAHGFAPVGFLPQKHPLEHRESVALFCRHFSGALELRCNNPRVVPEAHALAHLALSNTGLPTDVIVDEEALSYPPDADFAVEDLTADGLPALLRIERGRVRGREIYGPMRLQYGFFRLAARRATYLLARRDAGPNTPIAGALGLLRDDLERSVRIFECIAPTDQAVRFLFETLLERAEHAWGVAYIEVDVSAAAPRMQRTLVELGFLPAAYVPAMVFHAVERLDVVKMVRLFGPLDPGPLSLTPDAQRVADLVLGSFQARAVLPRIAEAIGALDLVAGLHAEQVARLAGLCAVASFAEGEALFRAGDASGAVWVLLEGAVSVRLGDREVGRVRAREVLGELALLTGEAHTADAIALGPVAAAVLSRDALGGLIRSRPDIGLALYRNLALSLGQKLIRSNRAATRG